MAEHCEYRSNFQSKCRTHHFKIHFCHPQGQFSIFLNVIFIIAGGGTDDASQVLLFIIS